MNHLAKDELMMCNALRAVHDYSLSDVQSTCAAVDDARGGPGLDGTELI